MPFGLTWQQAEALHTILMDEVDDAGVSLTPQGAEGVGPVWVATSTVTVEVALDGTVTNLRDDDGGA